MLGITAYKKFVKTGAEVMDEELKEEKDNDPKHIPYLFCCCESAS